MKINLGRTVWTIISWDFTILLKGHSNKNHINIIKNRNQRVWLSRYRTSAHNLRVESGRYTNPVTPVLQCTCNYCNSGECDTELHAILVCETFKLKRQCFLSRMTAFFSCISVPYSWTTVGNHSMPINDRNS